MPTVLRVGRYRFLFFSNEGHEPPHIHVKADRDEAEGIIREHWTELMEAWHEHLG